MVFLAFFGICQQPQGMVWIGMDLREFKGIDLLGANWALFCFETALRADCCVAAWGKQNIPENNF